jgi:hypothetical protein
VPTFAEPDEFTGDIHRLDDNDLKVIVEEGRRQLDRQLADLDRNRTRAATLLTISVGEVAVLSASAHRAFSNGPVATVAWAISALLAVLAAGGAASLLTSQARFDRLDTRHLVEGRLPALRNVALGYARSVGTGEETIRTRVTVLRDGVLLAVLAALLYAIIWPFTYEQSDPAPTAPPSPSGATSPCQPTCTRSSLSPSLPTGAPTVSPGPVTTTGPNGPSPTPSSPRP